MEDLIDRSYISSTSGEQQNISIELTTLLSNLQSSAKADKGYIAAVLSEAEGIISTPWFKTYYSKSTKLTSFLNSFKSLKTI